MAGTNRKSTRRTAPRSRPRLLSLCWESEGGWRKKPYYKGVYVFDNDFGSLMKDEVEYSETKSDFFSLKPERGINRVICFFGKPQSQLIVNGSGRHQKSGRRLAATI